MREPSVRRRRPVFANFEFRDPWLLLALLAVPVVYWAAARLPSVLTYSSLSLPEAGPRSLRVRLSKLPAVLFALAAAAIVIALAGPRTGDATTSVHKKGIAIVMAVDRSGSMAAVDFVEHGRSISRLDAVKHVFRDFVVGGEVGGGRPNDLIGLVVFGTYADGMCPLTLDHGNLLNILSDVGIPTERSEQATAIGEGLGLAVERLRENKAASKVIILLTDGVNNAGELDPEAAARLAAANHITVYTIGVGASGYAPVPVPARDGRMVLQRVYVEIDEAALKQIARITGGRYFHASDTEGLKKVYREIDRLERSDVTEVRYMQYREHYVWAAVSALVLIVGAALAGATVFRRLP